MGGQILPIDPFSGHCLGLSVLLDQWRYQRLYFVVSRLSLCRVVRHSPTFPWWSIFAFVKSAHLNFRKLVILFAMEIIQMLLN
jgi:hypothetical protein